MKEEFRKIEGFERYAVSNKGNVKNIQTGAILSQRKATNGYLRVNLRKGNVKYEKPTTKSVHRLVAEHFIPLEEGKTYVNHLDCDKTNNNVDNLEWVTPQENSMHAYESLEGYSDICNRNIKKAQKETLMVLDVFRYGEYIGRCRGKANTAKELGINEKTIYNSLKGMPNRKGYSFFIVNGGG